MSSRPTRSARTPALFNGVDVTFNVRSAKGVTFTGGTSTGKVEDDICELRAAVPENYLLNPYCQNSRHG